MKHIGNINNKISISPQFDMEIRQISANLITVESKKTQHTINTKKSNERR